MTGPAATGRHADPGGPETPDDVPRGPRDGTRPTTAGRASHPADPLVAALARYVEALDRRYPDGPDQLRRERLDGRATMRPMRIVGRDPAA